MEQPTKVLIVGAGAAGLVAAGRAAEAGGGVAVLEKMRRPGVKLRITGKGRCNFTNVAPVEDFVERFGRNGRFLKSALFAFGSQDLIDFFERIDIPSEVQRGGRVFPKSGRAQDVVDALVRWAQSKGVVIRTQTRVLNLLFGDGGRVRGVSVSGKGGAVEEVEADAVIIATGGASYPATGSTGDGYALAESAGHAITPVRPALVPLETGWEWTSRLAGLHLRNVSVTLWIDGNKSGERFGEMDFIETGVSGPVILALSREAVDAWRAGQAVELSIDLKPALDEVKLDARLLREFEGGARQSLRDIMNRLLPKDLIPLSLEQTGARPQAAGSEITADERRRLRLWLKDVRVPLAGPRGWDEAIITAGGVNLREIDPRAMRSKRVNNLYFAGEVLDLDADTGGYNLQAAFSTGWMAGAAAAKRPVHS